MFPYSLNLGDMISEYMTSFLRSIFSLAAEAASLSSGTRAALSSAAGPFFMSVSIYGIYQINAQFPVLVKLLLQGSHGAEADLLPYHPDEGKADVKPVYILIEPGV